MSDYISVCKFMNVPKPGLGLKLIQKWADQLGFDRTRIREGGKASNETLVKKLEQNTFKKVDQTKEVEKNHVKSAASIYSKLQPSGDYIGSKTILGISNLQKFSTNRKSD